MSNALSSSEAAQRYNNSQLGFIWSSSRYPAYAQGVYANLVQITEAAAAVYKQTNGARVLSSINTSDPSIARTILDPISVTSIDLHPMLQGGRFYYNTVSMVMPILIQFFFVMALNGISLQTKLSNTLPPLQHTLLRFIISVVYTLVAALVMTGYIWAFREDWQVTSDQFALTWMAIWLAMHINFLLIDCATAMIPMPFIPYFILTWIIINVTSTIGPLEQSAGFYRLSYAIPTHQLYQVLMDIWTQGCNPYLYRALPILFAEWVVGLGLFVAGMRKRTAIGVNAVFESRSAGGKS